MYVPVKFYPPWSLSLHGGKHLTEKKEKKPTCELLKLGASERNSV